MPRDPESLIISATKGQAGTCATCSQTGEGGKSKDPQGLRSVSVGPLASKQVLLERGNERKVDTSGSLMLANRGAGKGGERFVRKRRREVFRGGWARPLLGCQPGEPQQVRRGVHQLLLRLPQEPEPITELGFVSHLEIEGGAVAIRLRLPTYFCAPNFAYLMVADAREAALSVPGIGRVSVILEEHYASEELNTSFNTEGGFDDAFPGETEGPDLEELRTIVRRKSFVSRQERLCRTLISEGRSPQELAAMRLGEMAPSQDFEKYLERRKELGLDASEEAPLVVDPEGNRVPEEAVIEHLRFAKTVRVSIDGNAGLCRGLLDVRYGGARGVGQKEEATL